MEWINHQYGSGATLHLGYGQTVVVVWDKDGYKVSAFGATLKARIRDVEPAKQAGIKLARQIVAILQQRLQEVK